MRRKISTAGVLLSGILALTMLISGAAAIDNLVANPDFDVDIEGWSLGNLVDGAVAEMLFEANGFVGGCLYVKIDGVGDAGYKPEIHSPAFAVEQDKVYTLALWAKTGTGITRDLNIAFEQDHDPWDGPGETFVVNDQWTEYYHSPVMPFTDDNVVIHLGTQQQMGDVWVDNVRVYQGDYVAEDLVPVTPIGGLTTAWGQIRSR